MYKKILLVTLTSVIMLSGLFYFFGDTMIPILIASFMIIKTKALLITTKLYASSKKKMFMFLKTLTMTKALTLGVKRFFIDNVFSKWLAKNIIDPIKNPIIGYLTIYRKLSMKEKMRRLLIIFLPVSIVTGLMFAFGMLEGAFLYAEIKTVVIGFFKLLWVFGAKILAFFTTGWFATILEIFALSWILSKVEKIPYIGEKIVAFSDFIGKKFRYIFVNIKIYYRKYFEIYLERHISKKVRTRFYKYGERFTKSLNNFKTNNELFLIKVLLSKEAKYFSPIFKKKKVYRTVDEKIEAMRLLNKKTNDSLDVRGFYNTDNVWDGEINSVLIFESFASMNDHNGNTSGKILKEHFWVLNLTEKIFSLEVNEKEYDIKPGKIKLMKSNVIKHPLHSKFELIEIH